MMRRVKADSQHSYHHGKRAEVVLCAFTLLISLLCVAVSLFISTSTWTQWFFHPSHASPEHARQGAVLWRVMLAVNAVAMVGALIVLRRLVPGARIPNHDESMNSTSLSRKRRWSLVAVVLLGLAFRATRLNESLWYDEIASWMTYTAGIDTAGAIVSSFLDPINHVAHTLLNWVSVKIFTSSLIVELAFRIPALSCSLVSILAMFGLARAACGFRVAMFAAGLMAVLPVPVLEGAEARGYSMMICFAALMTWLFIEARKRKQAWLWMAYSLSCALGIWSHFVTACVPIGHGIWLAWRTIRCAEWRAGAAAFIALALGAAMTITLYAPMIPAMLAAKGMFVAQRSDQPGILGPEGLHALLQLGGSWYWWAAAPGLVMGLIGAASVIRNGREAAGSNAACQCTATLALIGLPVMLLGVALGGLWVYARFTLFALPGAVLLIAIGIDAMNRWRLGRWVRLAAIVAIAAIFAGSITDLALRPPKQPLRDAADYVRAHRSEHDRLLVIGLAHEVMRMYAGDLELTYSLRHGAELDRKLIAVDPQWVIVEYPTRVSDSNYQLLRERGYEEVATFRGWADWTQGDVLVLHRLA